MMEPKSEPIDQILKQSLRKLHHLDKFNDYLEYLHKEWLYTVSDIEAISLDESAWANLKLPTRLKIELIVLTDSDIGEIETHEASGNTTDPEVSPTQNPYSPLLNEWVLHWSSEFESYYYYNTVTLESTWDCPDKSLNYEYQEQEWTEEELAEFAAAAEQSSIERPSVEVPSDDSIINLTCISIDTEDPHAASDKTGSETHSVYKYNHIVKAYHTAAEIMLHPNETDDNSDCDEDMTIIESPRPLRPVSKPIPQRQSSSGNKPVRDLFFSADAKKMSINRLSLSQCSPEKLTPRNASFRARMIALAASSSGDNSVRTPPPKVRTPLPSHATEKPASSPRATAYALKSDSPRPPVVTISSKSESSSIPPAPHNTPLVESSAFHHYSHDASQSSLHDDEVIFESVPATAAASESDGMIHLAHHHEEGNFYHGMTAPSASPVMTEILPPHPPATENPHNHRVYDVNAPAPKPGSVAFVVDTPPGTTQIPRSQYGVSHIPVRVVTSQAPVVESVSDSGSDAANIKLLSGVQQRIADLKLKERQVSMQQMERAEQHPHNSLVRK